MSQKCETKFCRHEAAEGYVLCPCCLHGPCTVWRRPSKKEAGGWKQGYAEWKASESEAKEHP